MSDVKDQIRIAEKFGYVESLGSKNLQRGSLVPFDHHTSPLTTKQIEDLLDAGYEPGVITPNECA